MTKRFLRSIGKAPAKLFTDHLHLPLPAHVLKDPFQGPWIIGGQWFQVLQSAKDLVSSKNHRQLLPHSLNSRPSLKSEHLVDHTWLLVHRGWVHLCWVVFLFLKRFHVRFGVKRNWLRLMRNWRVWKN